MKTIVYVIDQGQETLPPDANTSLQEVCWKREKFKGKEKNPILFFMALSWYKESICKY